MSPTPRRAFLRTVAGLTAGTGALAAGTSPGVARSPESADGSPAAAAPAAAAPADWPYRLAWRRTLGDGPTRLNAVTATADGFLAVGRAEVDGDWEAWLCATDREGGVRWQTTVSEGWSSTAFAVAPTPDGGAVVAGRWRARRQTPQRAWLRRVDADGTVAWRRTYGGGNGDGSGDDGSGEGGDDTPTAIVRTAEGYLFAGTTRSQSDVGAAGWLVAVDDQGTVRWQRTYGGAGDQRVHDLVPAAEGFLLVGTTTPSAAALPDARLVRVGADGAPRWERIYGGDGFDRANAAIRTDEGFHVAGMTSTPDGVWDVWLFGVDDGGAVQWRRTHGGAAADDYALDLVEMPEGALVVGSTTGEGSGGLDELMLGVDPRGRYRWHRIHGASGRDVGRAVVPAADGYLVAGLFTDPSTQEGRGWLTRLVEPTPTPTPEATPTPEGTPIPTVGLPTTTEAIDPIDMDEVRDSTTTSDGGPGFGVAGALAALGLGAWLGRRRESGD